MFTKKLYLFCSKASLNIPNSALLCRPETAVSILHERKFASKKLNGEKISKNKSKINKYVNAQNEFVTHQLNTSIAAHLKRQQKILNHVQKEEKFDDEKRRLLEQSKIERKPIVQSAYKVRDDNDGYKNSTVNRKTSDKSRPNHFNEKSNYHKHRIGHAKDDNLNESDSDDYSIEKLEIPNWDEIELDKFNKIVYRPSERSQRRHVDEVNAFRTKMHIKIDSKAPNPIFLFNELGDLSEQLNATLENQHFFECTPIQAQGIPLALTGANMLAISQSGSGKMLAMILSTVIHILNQDQMSTKNEPRAVILAPTKELVEEIRQLAHDICERANIRYTIITKNHIEALAVNSLLITTAEHLYEILRTKSLKLPNCSHLALYEADRMIDMCMEEEILQIASQIRCECQRLIWSSSWNGDINELATNLLHDFVRLDIGTILPRIYVAENVKQIIKISDENGKKDVLDKIVGQIKAQSDDQKVLIFVETPIKANKITSFLRKNGHTCRPLHNGKSQLKRHETFLAFQKQQFNFLILTDTATKNLQFTQISDVIHFDMPNTIVEYTHRVNRTTGNAYKIGTSHAIVTEDDGHLAADLIEILQQTNQDVNPALLIMKAANADSDDEISFAVPNDNGYQKYTIDSSEK